MNRTSLTAGVLFAFALLLPAASAQAQPKPYSGRFSLFVQGGSWEPDDGSESRSFSEAVANLAFRTKPADEGGFELALDGRGSTYANGDLRRNRATLYEAWVGGRTRGGTWGLRIGQMWINDLGGLGSVGGLLVEYRNPVAWKAGRLRLGLFGGLEPKGIEAGYVSGVKKAGAYAVLEGEKARRHVAGLVTIRNSGLTERSVLTFTNYVPVRGKLWVYQIAEVDLVGPGGNGSGGLTYFFANARYNPIERLELQALFHRGRSIDARTITQDQLDGKPVDSRLLAGYLFESLGGRVSYVVARGVRLYAGYAQDRSNQDDVRYGRLTAGLHAMNVFGSGVDVTVSDNRMERASGSYDSWYASVGRSLGPKVYVSLDYATALSVVRFSSTGGVQLESRPRTKRYSLYGSFNLSRAVSLLLTAEQMRDDEAKELRGMAGLSIRF